jgi:hypothetical protein
MILSCSVSHVVAQKSADSVPLHVLVPKTLFDKLLARLATIRKTNPLANLSDAVRDAIEEGVRGKR